MSVASKLNIFGEPAFDESIWREEDHTHHPQTTAFENNDEIEISINQQDALIDFHEGYLQLECVFEPVGEAAQGAGGVCTLSNNCGLFLFDRISYELNGHELEVVRDPGIATTLRALACYNPHEANALAVAGWNPTGVGIPTYNAADRHFSLRIPLWFIFNLFNDYNHVLMGRHKIRLVRHRSDADCYTSTGTSRATIDIQKITLKVRHVYPNDEIKLELLKSIGSGRTFKIPYRLYELHELPALRATNKENWPLKTGLKIEKVVGVIAAYQTNRRENAASSAAVFDHIGLRNIHLSLNSVRYPFENQNFNFAQSKYLEAFQNYCDYARNFHGKTNVEPTLTWAQFLNNAIFIIDSSKQADALQSATVDVKLSFESQANFAQNTRAYALIIHEKIVEYSPLLGTVREIQ